MKKVWNVIKKIINVILVIFVLLFVLAVCLQRFSDNRLSIFNYRMFKVVSGSMEPKYKIGDVLVAKKVDPKDVKVGDAVSYLGNTGSLKNKIITHEVVEIETGEDGKLIFHTKGLSNIIEDPIVHEEQLYGVVVYKAVVLSFIYSIIAKPMGMFILVIIPMMYIIASEIIATLLDKEEKRRSKKED